MAHIADGYLLLVPFLAHSFRLVYLPFCTTVDFPVGYFGFANVFELTFCAAVGSNLLVLFAIAFAVVIMEVLLHCGPILHFFGHVGIDRTVLFLETQVTGLDLWVLWRDQLV